MNDRTRWWVYTHAQAGNAWQLAQSLAASMPLAAIHSEDEHRITPRQIASFACDVAQAMVDELERREWLIFCDPPTPPAEVEAKLRGLDQRVTKLEQR